ncbi:MAG TPA: hypothetical protein VF251_02245 [Pyrinomonadaceae bacterium]
MKKLDLYKELVTIYQRHGWQLRTVLFRPETIAEMKCGEDDPLQSVTIKDSPVDALWFSRPSHQQREAWELRLLSETQYALFETFEADETEEQREEMRQEMEARLREYVQR